TMIIWKKGGICKNSIGIDIFDVEGRVQTLDLGNIFIVNTYFPNSQRGLTRLKYKLSFCKAIIKYAKKLSEEKGTVVTGDMNIAHEDIDLKNPKENANNAGFTLPERNQMSSFISNGFIDTYRYLHKEAGHYTWWSNFANARARNIGWRIDYFMISQNLLNKLKDSIILENITGSDHAPIELLLFD
ncbi:MAG: exodeoxyribonuclease III, partial [Candidatus Micrarchaeaceae archaeon]